MTSSTRAAAARDVGDSAPQCRSTGYRFSGTHASQESLIRGYCHRWLLTRGVLLGHSAMGAPVISAKKVCKSFGNTAVLRDASLDVKAKLSRSAAGADRERVRYFVAATVSSRSKAALTAPTVQECESAPMIKSPGPTNPFSGMS